MKSCVIIYSIILSAFLISSCGSNHSVYKRKYNKGYYVSNTKTKYDTQKHKLYTHQENKPNTTEKEELNTDYVIASNEIAERNEKTNSSNVIEKTNDIKTPKKSNVAKSAKPFLFSALGSANKPTSNEGKKSMNESTTQAIPWADGGNIMQAVLGVFGAILGLILFYFFLYLFLAVLSGSVATWILPAILVILLIALLVVGVVVLMNGD